MEPIQIEDGTEKTCWNFSDGCGNLAEPDGDITIKIKKPGCCEYLIEYPGNKQDDDATCEVCFEWGELMWELEAGRYIGDIFEDDENKIGSVQFELHRNIWEVHHCTEPEVVEDDDGCTCITED